MTYYEQGFKFALNLLNVCEGDLDEALEILNNVHYEYELGDVMFEIVQDAMNNYGLDLNKLDLVGLSYIYIFDKASQKIYENEELERAFEHIEVYTNSIDSSFECRDESALNKILEYAGIKGGDSSDLFDALVKIAND